jgi:glutamate synthase (NADPH/NADH) small chain
VNVAIEELRAQFDAIALTGGSTRPRDLPVPGRELKGIHFAMEFLTQQNRRNEGDHVPEAESISAKGKHVIIIGGGDTGADCLGTTHRQGAASVHQLELLSRPPDDRTQNNPWPTWPNIFRVSTAHEEGGERLYSISTRKFTGDANGQVTTSARAPRRDGPEGGPDGVRARAGQRVRAEGRPGAARNGFPGPKPTGCFAPG